MEENKIEEPIGKFIIENAKGTETQNGVYYHYNEVCTLLKKQKKQLILSGVSQQRKLLFAMVEHINTYLDSAEGFRIGVVDEFLEKNCS